MNSFDLSTAAWRVRDCSGKKWLPAVVPGCVHLDLVRAGEIPDPFWGTNELGLQWIEERDWEYRATFTASEALLAEQKVELAAEGLDTLAEVTLNGKVIAETDNMFVPHRWEVKRLLRRGRNVLSIRFSSARRYIDSVRPEHTPKEINDPVGGGSRLRKEQCQFGWDWGPRFVTAGIWQGLRLEGWTGNAIESVIVRQSHESGGRVRLALTPELAKPDRGATLKWRLELDKKTVVAGEGPEIVVDQPQLWWPAGQGDQPLYTLTVEVSDTAGGRIGTWERRIGLRTIELDRSTDEWGRAFRFVVNGRPVFAKGANWIPAHSFVAGLKRADYERDLRSAVAANMNMMRVWGGGIYENEAFFDVCDELGLLVWQDFMFACTCYPGDDAFVASVAEEAAAQVKRLRHRASLALWCGNNEIYALNTETLQPGAPGRIAYDRVFHETLPEAVAANDGVTAYWPSSPWREGPEIDTGAGEVQGDTHYWDVWHARKPVKEYELWKLRFCAEFGMQSYSSEATNATFCPPDDANVFGATMENHQKNRAGNQIILDYVSRRYRFPKDQAALIYLSQLNQAYCMQVGVEHYRRLMPRCMGALYWQLNDCWPVASWSSIEFTGRWKALHYGARRFYAPALVSAHVPGDEGTTIGNYRNTTVREVHLHTVYDAPEPARGTLRWSVCHLDGRTLSAGQKAVRLVPGTAVNQRTLDLSKVLASPGRDSLYLRIGLEVDGVEVSGETVFLAPPRFLTLPQGRTRSTIKSGGTRQAEITFTSDVFQHRFVFDLPGVTFQASDNWFDLYPGEPKTVTVDLARSLPLPRLRKLLTHQSLVDTY